MRRRPSGFDSRRSRRGPGFAVEAPPYARDGSGGKYVGGRWMNKTFPEAAIVRRVFAPDLRLICT
jgi:hypothetical protein